jgi:hypothetical protein
MQHVLAKLREIVFGTLSVPLMLGVMLLPILLPLFLISFFSDSPADLGGDCGPTTIQQQMVQFVAPVRFWSREEKAFTSSLARPFTPPSAEIRRQTARAMQTISEVTRDIRVPPTSHPDQLRAEADRIEHEQTLRALDQRAYVEWRERREFKQRCLTRARNELAKRSDPNK